MLRKKITIVIRTLYIVSVAFVIGGMIFSAIMQRRNVRNTNFYKDVSWNTEVNYTAGDCDTANYSAWAPHNLQYDKTREKFIFLQCHRNGHTGEFSEMTLCYLNPADPLEYEMLNCPSFSGLGSLLVADDGTWYIWTDQSRYTSINAGITWEEDELYTELPARYGIYEIDGVLYAGDDSGEAGVYRISSDMGLTWEKKYFGVNYIDCEAAFCKFKGETYAFLRTNTNEYACILQETENGWNIINDNTILAGNSNCSPVAFDDYIAIAHTNREDCHLYYTIWDGENDFKTTDLGKIESSTDYQGDFHCPTLAFGGGYAAITFMMHTYGNEVTGSYIQAQNNWIIGTYENGKSILKCRINDPYKKNLKDAETSVKFNGLTAKYPETAEVSQNEVVTRWMCNNNGYGVSLYNPEDRMENYRTLTLDGFLVPVCHGKLIAYGTEAIKIDVNKITPVYLGQYQPYCVVEYKGSNYMCITSFTDDDNMMMSLQRKNVLYESSAVVDCVNTDEVTRICYIAPYSTSEMTGVLQYAEISTEASNKDIEK